MKASNEGTFIKEDVQLEKTTGPAKRNNKYLSAEKYQEYKDILSNHFPNAIGCKPIKVLKIGILEDILEKKLHGISLKGLKAFLKGYCGSKGYKKRLKVGNDRHDLQGNAVSKVTEQECKFLEKQQSKKV